MIINMLTTLIAGWIWPRMCAHQLICRSLCFVFQLSNQVQNQSMLLSSSRAMASSEAQILPNEEESIHSSLRVHPTPRRTSMLPPLSPSDSADSSIGSSLSSSLNEEFPTFTHLKLINGVPFSWEQIPGKPKRQVSMKKEPSGCLLPLPPAGNSNSRNLQNQEETSPKKYQTSNRTLKRDPFFAALVACSKDEHKHGTFFCSIWKGSSKFSRTLSDGFGSIDLHASCKRSCPISESIVYLPKSSPFDYNLPCLRQSCVRMHQGF